MNESEYNENYLKDALASPSGLKVYRDGEEYIFAAGSEETAEAADTLREINEGGYEMPALGVSLDRLTKEEMRSGLWAEFLYDRVKEHRGMPFDSLLICVRENDCGYSAIRGVCGRYDGRVFYYSLARGKTLADFRKALVRITDGKNQL